MHIHPVDLKPLHRLHPAECNCTTTREFWVGYSGQEATLVFVHTFPQGQRQTTAVPTYSPRRPETRARRPWQHTPCVQQPSIESISVEYGARAGGAGSQPYCGVILKSVIHDTSTEGVNRPGGYVPLPCVVHTSIRRTKVLGLSSQSAI